MPFCTSIRIGPISVETGPLLAEQERPKIGDVAELVGVELLDEPHPGPFDQVTDQFVEGPEAVGDSGLQRDSVAPVQVLVEELQPLVAHGLQLPQRHDADDLIDFGNQG